MRRFDVYFLQKRDATGWETLERAQSASVLVSSMVREFDGEADAELRVVGGDWNAAIGEWEFSQIFFVDRGSIDLSLAEPGTDDAGDGVWDTGPDRDTDAVVPPPPAERGNFADAIHAAQDEIDHPRGSDGDEPLDERLTASAPTGSRLRDGDETILRDDGFDDDPATNEDLRSLGFARNAMGVDEPVGPPPDFRPEPRRRGRAFFMVGTVLISLILIVGVAIALMVFFKVDPAPRYLEMLKDWRLSTMATDEAMETSAATAVQPRTAPDVVRHEGVPPALWGRWSTGDCDEFYLEFDHAGFVMKPAGQGTTPEVLVSETLEDEYTWYIRRSDELVEHLQKLGENVIQKIGDTTPVGFTQRTSDVFTRCGG